MKIMILQRAKQQKLRDKDVFHTHLRACIRAQIRVRLNQKLTLQQTANEFRAYLNRERLQTLK